MGICVKKNPPPFTLAPKTNTKEKKYLGINLTKYVQDLYKENYKALMNEMKDLNEEGRHSTFMDRKTQCCQEDSQWQFLSNYRFNKIPMKI